MIFGGIKNIIIAAVIGFVVGGIGGWRVEAWRSNAAFYRAEVKRLNKIIEAGDAAAEKDAAQISKDAETIEQLKRKVEDAEKQTSPGECLPSDDADRVRNYFDQP